MPGAKWFTGAQLNYAEHLVGREEDLERVAVVAQSQTREPEELTFGDLRARVARARAGLQRLGVGPGDRVVAYMPNIPETLVGFIATASLGAIWATCAPEFGARSVVARFAQIEPKVLFCVGGYGFRDRYIDRRAEVEAIRSQMPSLEHVVSVPYGEAEVPDTVSWDELARGGRHARVRPGALRSPAVRALLLGHDGAAQGDRPRPRRSARRAPQEPGPGVEPQAGRAAAVVLDDRLDDVERARLLPAAARLDRDARRRPQLAGSRRDVAAGRFQRGDGARRFAARTSWPAARPASSSASSSASPSSRSSSPRARRCPPRDTGGSTSSWAPTSC